MESSGRWSGSCVSARQLASSHAEVAPSEAGRANLEVSGLQVDLGSTKRDIVAEVSFTVREGEALGLVGESGSGKTTVALALLGFARPGAKIVGGQVVVGGRDILTMN